MLVRYPEKYREQRYGEKCSVDICYKVRFRVGVIRKYILSRISLAPAHSHRRCSLTLARKLDAVHRNTVTSRRNIPRVRRAICSNPNPALKPRLFSVDVDRAEDIDVRSCCSDSLSCDNVNSSATVGRARGSCELMMRVVLMILYTEYPVMEVGGDSGVKRPWDLFNEDVQESGCVTHLGQRLEKFVHSRRMEELAVQQL